MVSLDRAALATHPAAASAAIACLLVSAILLGQSFRLTSYVYGPAPESLMANLTGPPLAVRAGVVSSLAEAIGSNDRLLAARFRWLNTAMGLALVGGIIYGVGVGFA